MNWNRYMRVTVSTLAMLAAAGAGCVPAEDGTSVLADATAGPKVTYLQLLDGAFQTKFFDDQPFPDGPTYNFDSGTLSTVFDFFGDGQLMLDFVNQTAGTILVENQPATVFPGSSRVIRGGMVLGFSGDVSNNGGTGPFTLTDPSRDFLTAGTQDFLASVAVGDTVEIEGGTGAIPGLYTVIDVAATTLTLGANAGDTGGAGDLVYNVRNDGDTVLVRFDLTVAHPDSSQRAINVGLVLSFSYDGQSLVGTFHSDETLEDLDSGIVNIALRRTESVFEATESPTTQPSG